MTSSGPQCKYYRTHDSYLHICLHLSIPKEDLKPVLIGWQQAIQQNCLHQGCCFEVQNKPITWPSHSDKRLPWEAKLSTQVFIACSILCSDSPTGRDVGVVLQRFLPQVRTFQACCRGTTKREVCRTQDYRAQLAVATTIVETPLHLEEGTILKSLQ